MKQDASFGIIPLRFMKGKWEIFLVQLRRGHHWGFPKGHPEQGEEPLASALRELKEETQLEVLSLLSKEPLVETYRFTSQGELIEKQVTYFIAQVTGEAALQEEEVEN
jgi:bis(5'-nucleosidyl)-tetraphosphatase